MKKITVNGIDPKVYTGSTIYVTIDIFTFTKDKDLPCVEVGIGSGDDYEFLEEIETTSLVIDHDDLKNVAFEWILRNVSIKD